MRTFILFLFSGVISISYAFSMEIDGENDYGNPECEYLWNIDISKNQTVNICSSRQDARCLIDFNVDVTLYNLQEHYGLSSLDEKEPHFVCNESEEFLDELLNLTNRNIKNKR